MSELKAHRFITTDELFPEANAGALYYDKSEADKVIAEKDKEIAELGKYIDELQDKVTGLLLRDRNMALNFNNAFNALTHSNYKRCLAMAKLCHWKMGVFIYKEEKSNFYHRWHKRWLELAKKFKWIK